MIPPVDQFLSTYQEWHYFVGGLSIGLAAGYILRDVLAIYSRLELQS